MEYGDKKRKTDAKAAKKQKNRNQRIFKHGQIQKTHIHT